MAIIITAKIIATFVLVIFFCGTTGLEICGWVLVFEIMFITKICFTYKIYKEISCDGT